MILPATQSVHSTADGVTYKEVVRDVDTKIQQAPGNSLDFVEVILTLGPEKTTQ